MMTWKYIIQTENGKIITMDPFYAEWQSRRGRIVFCKRESNFFRFH